MGNIPLFECYISRIARAKGSDHERKAVPALQCAVFSLVDL